MRVIDCGFYLVILPVLVALDRSILAEPLIPSERINSVAPTIPESPDRTLGETLALIGRKTGIGVQADPKLAPTIVPFASKGQPFWTVIDRLAMASQAQVVVREQGRRIELLPGRANGLPASVDGPFRFVPQELQIRQKFSGTGPTYELMLELQAEPRFPVFRVDAQPTILSGLDDAKRPLTTNPIGSRTSFDGFTTMLKLPITGLTRESKSIATLTGEVRVTAADRWHTLVWTSLDPKRVQPIERDGVTAALKQVAIRGNDLLVDLEMKRPSEGPVFETFEVSALAPEVTLVQSSTQARFTPSERDVSENGDRLRVRMRFPLAMLKWTAIPEAGWSIECRTAGRIREVPLRFEFRDVPLP